MIWKLNFIISQRMMLNDTLIRLTPDCTRSLICANIRYLDVRVYQFQSGIFPLYEKHDAILICCY